MSLQTIGTYCGMAVQYLNEYLRGPVETFQSKLSLKTEALPDFLHTPVYFTAMMTMIVMTIISFANNFICNLIGILYPVMYGFYLFTDAPSDRNTQRSVTYNKYWILFGSITIIDMMLGFVLSFIPGYYYAKVAFIYLLIRDDFSLTDSVFGLIVKYYETSNFRPRIESILTSLNKKLGYDKKCTVTETNKDTPKCSTIDPTKEKDTTNNMSTTSTMSSSSTSSASVEEHTVG